MTISSIRHAAMAMLGLAALAAAPAAHAQYVVTDQDAGKLTLEALTAAPAPRAYYRPILAYRHVRRTVSMPRTMSVRHTVMFQPRFVEHPAGHRPGRLWHRHTLHD